MFRTKCLVAGVVAIASLSSLCHAQTPVHVTNTFSQGSSVTVTLDLYNLVITGYTSQQVLVGYEMQGTYPNLVYVPIYQTVQYPNYQMQVVSTATGPASAVTQSMWYDPDGSGPLPGSMLTYYTHHAADFVITGPYGYYTVTWHVN
jgi:hypothetical protein